MYFKIKMFLSEKNLNYDGAKLLEMSSTCLNLIRIINAKLNVKKAVFFQFSNLKKPSWVFWVEFFMPTLLEVGILRRSVL